MNENTIGYSGNSLVEWRGLRVTRAGGISYEGRQTTLGGYPAIILYELVRLQGEPGEYLWLVQRSHPEEYKAYTLPLRTMPEELSYAQKRIKVKLKEVDAPFTTESVPTLGLGLRML